MININKSLLLLLLSFLAFPATSIAQNTIEGVVLDASNKKPLRGASVVNNQSDGTSTNRQGKFTLPCADTLKVSYVGYKTAVKPVKNCDKKVRVLLTPSSKQFEEVEVTATSRDGENPLHQPASISKLDEQEINMTQGLFLDDAINSKVPGVNFSRRTVSGGQQINIRGYGNGVGFQGAHNNFNIRGTKVYLNGIPLTNAEGVTKLGGIDFASMGNVKVLKGPSSTRYGMAIAGVVNLETMEPEPGKTSIGQQVQIGEYGVRRYTTNLKLGTKNTSMLVNYGHQEADGYMKHSASTKDFVNMAGDFRLSDKQSISTYLGFTNSYEERGGQLTIQQYNNFDYSGNPRYINNNAHVERFGFRAGLTHQYQFSDHVSNATTLFGSAAQTNSSYAAGWQDNSPLSYGLRSNFNLDFSLGDQWALNGVAGLEMQRTRAHPMDYAMATDSSNPDGYNVVAGLRSNKISNTSTWSYYTEWTLDMPAGFSLTAGLGNNNTSIVINERTYNGGANEPRHFETEYTGLLAPHVAINKVFNKQFSLYASYNKGFRTPVSSNVIIGATGQLNKGLKPEEGDQFEVGTKGDLLNSRLNYQVALFRTHFSQKMTSVAVPLDSVTTKYTFLKNRGGQINQGVEVSFNYLAYQSMDGFFTRIEPWGTFTYNNSEYQDYTFDKLPFGAQQAETKNYDGKAVAGVSPITASAGINFNTRFGIYGNVNYRYKDAMPITSDGQNMTDPYNLLNAKLGYRHTFGAHINLDLYAGVNNITGTQYYNMVFIDQLPSAYLPAPYEANYFGGINLNYSF